MNSPIVGLGEVLWDVFRDGPRFGGAPANFACHARSLGAEVSMISAVGPEGDPLAGQALDKLKQRGIDTHAIQRNEHETGRVIVDVDGQGKPTYTFSKHPAWDFIEWTDVVAGASGSASAVCFGTLAQRSPISRATIHRFLTSASPKCLKVFDVNLRVDYWDAETICESLKRADILKLNNEELPIVAKACGLAMQSDNGVEEVRILETLMTQFGLEVIALTRGAEGATLMTTDAVDHCPAVPTAIRDTVGAGDAYTAAMIIGLQKNWGLTKVNEQAVRVAAYVCTQSGATPELPVEITAPFFAS